MPSPGHLQSHLPQTEKESQRDRERLKVPGRQAGQSLGLQASYPHSPDSSQ